MWIPTWPRRWRGQSPSAARSGFAAVIPRRHRYTHVVAYDFGDGSTAARLWWLLLFRARAVSLLDGGIARWVARADRRVASQRSRRRPSYEPSGERRRLGGHRRLREDPLPWCSRAHDGRYEGGASRSVSRGAHSGAGTAPIHEREIRGGSAPPLPASCAGVRAARRGAGQARRVLLRQWGERLPDAVRSARGFRNALLYGSWSDWCSVPTRAVATGSSLIPSTPARDPRAPPRAFWRALAYRPASCPAHS
jgi:hypothetical protein